MPVRQPIPHIGREQERLITITTNEVLSHPRMVLNPPDDTIITRHPLANSIVSQATFDPTEAIARPGAGFHA